MNEQMVGSAPGPVMAIGGAEDKFRDRAILSTFLTSPVRLPRKSSSCRRLRRSRRRASGTRQSFWRWALVGRYRLCPRSRSPANDPMVTEVLPAQPESSSPVAISSDSPPGSAVRCRTGDQGALAGGRGRCGDQRRGVDSQFAHGGLRNQRPVTPAAHGVYGRRIWPGRRRDHRPAFSPA